MRGRERELDAAVQAFGPLRAGRGAGQDRQEEGGEEGKEQVDSFHTLTNIHFFPIP